MLKGFRPAKDNISNSQVFLGCFSLLQGDHRIPNPSF